MKVAFLKPPIGGILGLEMLTFVEPLGPICVAAPLEEEGHECKVIDLRIDGEEEGWTACRRFDPDVVGLQCNFTTERNRTIRLAERVQREMPRAFVVVGGHDASREPHWFSSAGIDVIADRRRRGGDAAARRRAGARRRPARQCAGLVLNRDGGQLSPPATRRRGATSTPCRCRRGT